MEVGIESFIDLVSKFFFVMVSLRKREFEKEVEFR